LLGETDELYQMLQEVEMNSNHIRDWDRAGIVYLEYLRIGKQLREILSNFEAESVSIQFGFFLFN
jgi:hypothetical protein